MKRAPSVLLPPLLAVSLSGCAQKSDDSGADRDLSWSHTTEWAFGDTGTLITGMTSVWPFHLAAATDGRVYLLVPRQRQVLVLDAQGRLIDTLGREGSGPGELQGPAAIGVNDRGEITVLDVRERRFVSWGADGSAIPETPITWRIDHPQFHRSGDTLWYGTVLSGIEGQSEYAVVRRRAGDSSTIARLRREPRRVGDFPSCNARQISVQPLFAPIIHWARNSGHLVVNASAEYQVRVLRDGTPPLEITRPIPAATASEADALRAAEGWLLNQCVVPPAEVIRTTGFMATIPVVEAVNITPEGEVWVRRRESGQNALRIDVFDTTGAYLGTLPSGLPFPALFLTEDRYLSIGETPEGAPSIRAIRLSRGGAGPAQAVIEP